MILYFLLIIVHCLPCCLQAEAATNIAKSEKNSASLWKKVLQSPKVLPEKSI
jgi:hypothetical protein